MILKLLLVVCVFHFLNRGGNAFHAALMWGIGLAVILLLFNPISLGAMLWLALSFGIALGGFTLMTKLDGSSLYWIVTPCTMGLLIFV